MTLSESQRQIVECKKPRIIVEACPGSGKTYTVIERMKKLLHDLSFKRYQGIATLSFTNTACQEIQRQIPDLPYPSFIGTLDSFINTYIFLPYGHLLMGCEGRPEIVGTEYNKWYDYDSSRRNFNGKKIIDPNYFMDKVSYNIKDSLCPLAEAQEFSFSWKKIQKQNGDLRKEIKNMMAMKQRHFHQGQANQADANYFALKLLKNYPTIANNIIHRFPYLIIDEAQDTTEIQMAIVDLLDGMGIQSLMLVGDPNQAIFEWNTASPNLFKEKCTSSHWHHIELKENYRSSQNICQVVNHILDTDMHSIASNKDCSQKTCLFSYATKEEVQQIKTQFLEMCQKMGIHEQNYTVVYRGQSFLEKYFDIVIEDSHQQLWIKDAYYVRDIVQGKYLIDNGSYARGLQLIERGCYKCKEKVNSVSNTQLFEAIQKKGFITHRKKTIPFVDKLPSTNMTLKEWIQKVKGNTKCNLPINNENSNINIDLLFQDFGMKTSEYPYLRTIHSVKGMTLDAILVFLSHKAGSTKYETLLKEGKNKVNEEELRIVYVACTRPKKILWLAVPIEDEDIWRHTLRLDT